jgi:aminoglycoside phosphotransferase (APT) family kinase protein
MHHFLPVSLWTLIGMGRSAQVFSVGGLQVLKLFHARVSRQMIEREQAAATIAASLGLPTAAPLARTDVDGQPALLYPLVDGPSLTATLRKQPLSARTRLRAMGRLHHSIHKQPVTGLRTLKSVLQTDIDYGPASAALKQAAAAYLATLPEGDRLLHGDFHIDNIIVSGDRLVILDWAKAAIGDPAADVVRSEMLMLFGEGPADPITNLWRRWAAGQLRRAYAMPSDRLSAWRPIVALAWLRARPPVRTAAFHTYLNRALRSVGLPAYTQQQPNAPAPTG